MENEELLKIRNEISELRSQLSDMKAEYDSNFDSVNNLIKEVYTNAYQYIADIYDLLMPLVHKIFPQYAASKKQIDAIIKRPPTPNGNKKNS
ncbi:hypothetical protein [Nitrospirillum amazonense]|uniref:hypothetical protein n=1 Tax=Nitrospirillum amazonense TaxID=28077 RepID=UPI0011A0B651|nr:hypothetical protein [Nitrospirillum amazonense]